MRPRFMTACLAGVLATFVLTLVMYFFPPILAGGPADIAALLGSLLGGAWIVGMLAHFAMGTLILPGLYVLLYRRLWGTPAARGLTWGALLWLVSEALISPIIGGGLFSTLVGDPAFALRSLLGHVAYGLILGTLAGSGQLPARATERIEPHAGLRRAG